MPILPYGMPMINIPQTTLSVHPLCLGGNVFGWTADESQSFDILNAYSMHGGNFLDTADVYLEWEEGNEGGQSEIIIGNWMKKQGNRNSIVVATKVGKYSKRPGLSAKNIVAACNESLQRLQTDYIDIYFSHLDDEKTPLGETLEAYTKLIDEGKVRYIASSNFSPERLEEAIMVSKENGFASYIGAQNKYNLLDRKIYEDKMEKVITSHQLSNMPFAGLARGFLTGKYRKGVAADSVRIAAAAPYQDEKGWKTVEALEDIARQYASSTSAIALAWLRAQPGVSVPLASARNVEQLGEIVQVVELSQEDIARLSEITA